MVTRVNHGGHCCGAGHIYGFGDAEERDPDLIDAALAQVPSGRDTNVMLNLTQMRSRPNTIQRLADRGFVLTGHFINDNHGSHVFQFSRADKRLAFDAQSLRELGVTWPGMVISETLEGTMPNLPARPAPPPNGGRHAVRQAVYYRSVEHIDGPEGVGGRYRIREGADRVMIGNHYLWAGLTGTCAQIVGRGAMDAIYLDVNWPAPQRWVAGERYRINSPRSRRHEQVFELIRTTRDYYGNRKAVFRDIDGEFEISQDNVVFLPGEAVEPPAPPPIPEMRHRNRQVLVRPEEPRVVASLWANHYRTTGRSNTRFGSYDAAVERRTAGARGVTVDRLDIMADGTEIWHENVEA